MRFIKMKPLDGSVVKTELPKLTYHTYANEAFQKDFENYCRANFGFREVILRLYNQHLYRTKQNHATAAGN